MSLSIKQNFKRFDALQAIELKNAFTAVYNDLAAHRAAIVGITAKLDADGGVTDTNYAATWDPAALELTE